MLIKKPIGSKYTRNRSTSQNLFLTGIFKLRTVLADPLNMAFQWKLPGICFSHMDQNILT